jgi:hypothetical protein
LKSLRLPRAKLFQAPMSSPFATLPLSNPYSARVAYAKAHVSICHVLCWPTCLDTMIRLGWAGWYPFSSCPARPRYTYATTQAMESSVLFYSRERIRSHRGEAFQTTYGLSGETCSRIESQGGRRVGCGYMAKLFHVRLTATCTHIFILTFYYSTDFMGDMA